jgi:hypothetical protein
VTEASFADQTLIAAGLNHDESVHNFRIAEAYTLAFFDKYLKSDNGTILDTGAPPDARPKLKSFGRIDSIRLDLLWRNGCLRRSGGRGYAALQLQNVTPCWKCGVDRSLPDLSVPD